MPLDALLNMTRWAANSSGVLGEVAVESSIPHIWNWMATHHRPLPVDLDLGPCCNDGLPSVTADAQQINAQQGSDACLSFEDWTLQILAHSVAQNTC